MKVKENIEEKTIKLSGLLGIGDENKVYVKRLFLKSLQEHCETAFPMNNFSNIREEYLQSSERFMRPRSLKLLENLSKSKEFEITVEKINKLMLYVNLQDPTLKIPFSNNLVYTKLEKVDEFYCIDGFPKQNATCVIVVPQICKNNNIYQGIKPAVIVLSPEEKILTPQQQKELISEKKGDAEINFPKVMNEEGYSKRYELKLSLKSNNRIFKSDEKSLKYTNKKKKDLATPKKENNKNSTAKEVHSAIKTTRNLEREIHKKN